MPVIINKNSQQSPVVSGVTGAQVIKFFACDRVYVKTSDAIPAPPVAKSNGSTPAGWTDLGIVAGKVAVQYTKELAEVRTGLDNVLRQRYVTSKTAGFDFSLTQLDDVTISNLSGVTPYTVQAGSIVRFDIGSEDIVQKALLFVSQNKIDGKEIQFYHPKADVTFTLEDDSDTTVIRGTANCPAFTLGANELLIATTIFA